MLGELLIAEGALDADGLQEALDWQVLYGGRLGTNLLELRLIAEEQLAHALGKLHSCEVAFGELQVEPELVGLVPRHVADREEIVPWRMEKRRLKVLCTAPSVQVLDALSYKLGRACTPVVAPEFRVAQLLRREFGSHRQMRALDFGVVPEGLAERRRQRALQHPSAPAQAAPELIDEAAFFDIYNQVIAGRENAPAAEPSGVAVPAPGLPSVRAHAPVAPARPAARAQPVPPARAPASSAPPADVFPNPFAASAFPPAKMVPRAPVRPRETVVLAEDTGEMNAISLEEIEPLGELTGEATPLGLTPLELTSLKPTSRELTPLEMAPLPTSLPGLDLEAMQRPHPLAAWDAPHPPAPALDDTPLSFAQASALLTTTSDRNAIAHTVLRCARSTAARALLLSVQGGIAVGWDGLGDGLGEGAARRVAVPLSGESVFSFVVQMRSHFLGPLRKTPANIRFLEQCGKRVPLSALVLPIVFDDRVSHLLYLDNGHRQQAPTDIGEMLILAQRLGQTVSALVRRTQGQAP